ncbi:hypothetical protein DXG01_010814 [Tephrocybe rancida]|nr:hypothetical protein DXG01_010814 [Tephrocybe rancida]
MPKGFSALPEELRTYVFTEIQDDQPALTSCSLVCKDWHARAAPHIFRTLVLSKGAHFSGLRAILDGPPSRAISSIRDLTLDPLPIEHAATIAKALTTTVRLESLTLGYCPQWGAIPDVLRDALKATIQLPSLTALAFKHSMTMIPRSALQELFTGSTALKQLTMTGTKHVPPTIIPVHLPLRVNSDSAPRARIDVFNLEGGEGPLFEWLCSPGCSLDMSGLQCLNFTRHSDSSAASRLLKLAGPSLEELHFSIIHPEGGLDLSHNPRLRKLSFDCTNTHYISPGCCPPSCLHSTLATIHPDAQITELNLNLFVDTPFPDIDESNEQQDTGTPDPRIRYWDYSPWERLAQYFTTDSRFSALKNVTIEVGYDVADQAAYEDMDPYRDIAMQKSKLAFLQADVDFEMVNTRYYY